MIWRTCNATKKKLSRNSQENRIPSVSRLLTLKRLSYYKRDACLEGEDLTWIAKAKRGGGGGEKGPGRGGTEGFLSHPLPRRLPFQHSPCLLLSGPPILPLGYVTSNNTMGPDSKVKATKATGSDPGPVVQKPINANPRLKINQGVYFSSPKCCSTLIFGKTLH